MKLLKRYQKLLLYLLFPTISLVLHWEPLQLDICSVHSWRQTQTQTTIQNFAFEDFNILNPKTNVMGYPDGILRMEFPIMQWTFACFYKLFGKHIIISRILSLVIGWFSIFGFFHLVRALTKKTWLAYLSAWAFSFSPLFFYYTLNPMPDNLALCMSIWFLYFFYRGEQSTKDIVWSAIFLSLATLAKLPFVLYGIVYVIHFLRKSVIEKNGVRELQFQILYIMTAMIPPMLWYGSVVPTWDNGIVGGIFWYEGSLTTLYQYAKETFTVVFPESLLNSYALPFLLTGFFSFFERIKDAIHKGFHISILVLTITIVAYYIYEANMIELIHDYYLFPFLPLLFLIVAAGIDSLHSSNHIYHRILIYSIIIALPFNCMSVLNNHWNPNNPGFNKDLYAYKDDLRNTLPEDAIVIAGNGMGPYIWLYFLDRKGWVFDKNKLNKEGARSLIERGATHLVTDSQEVVDRVESISSNKLGEFGSITLIELKINMKK